MPKGKKFNAAEKHFEEKVQKLRAELHRVRKSLSEQLATNRDVRLQLIKLEEENQQLKDWVERLLEYTELPKREIATACEKDASIAQLAKTVNTLLSPNIFGGITGGKANGRF